MVCVGRRRVLDLVLLWLWCRPVATVPIRPLAWEPPHAVSTALKGQKEQQPKVYIGIPVVAQQKQIQLGTVRLQVRSLTLLSGLRLQHCREV